MENLKTPEKIADMVSDCANCEVSFVQFIMIRKDGISEF